MSVPAAWSIGRTLCRFLLSQGPDAEAFPIKSAMMAAFAASGAPMTLIIEIIGWIAAALILGAYALLSAGKMEARSRSYQIMNIVGSAGFIVNSGWNGAMPSAVLNVIWLGIGLVAMWRIRAA